MKKIIGKLLFITALLISIAVVYSSGYRAVFFFLNRRAVQSEKQINSEALSKPFMLIDSRFNKTLFFVPSSREFAVDELYGDWLRDLHKNNKVNIVAVTEDTDILSPKIFPERVSLKRRSSRLVSLYQLHRANADSRHKTFVLSTGDGSLAVLDLAPYLQEGTEIILTSPVTGNPDFRRGTIFHQYISFPFVSYLIPWLPEYSGKLRVGRYDILNDNLNNAFDLEKGEYYPLYINGHYERSVLVEAASQLEMLESPEKQKFHILYGDDDLSYSLEGFERLGDQLQSLGNEVSIQRISQSGRMLFFDNGKSQITDLIAKLMQ